MVPDKEGIHLWGDPNMAGRRTGNWYTSADLDSRYSWDTVQLAMLPRQVWILTRIGFKSGGLQPLLLEVRQQMDWYSVRKAQSQQGTEKIYDEEAASQKN